MKIVATAVAASVLVFGCAAHETTPDPTTDADLQGLALDAAWGRMSEVDRAEVCDAVDLLGAMAAARVIAEDAPEFDEQQVALWLAEKC